MYSTQPTSSSNSKLMRTMRKYFVSAFVVGSFAAYAIRQHNTTQNSDTALTPTTLAQPTLAQPTLPAPATNGVNRQDREGQTRTVRNSAPTAVPPTSVPPTAVPPTNTTAGGQYRDGQYTGNDANAFYGRVQVKAVIQNGRIVDVQFLDYPHDRRTSQRINNQAMPYLTSEAIQAQNAHVDIISGATLTSEAFIQSLQAALDSARA